MKIPLLPETDLARIAPLSPMIRRKALDHMQVSRPPYRYVPVKKSFSDILNIQAGFMGMLPRIPFARIEAAIRAASNSDAEEVANLRVAAGLYAHAKATELQGRRHDFFPLALGVGEKVVYWQSMVLSVDGAPLVPFFDPRRVSTRLTEQGRRFVFSMMHQRIRVAGDDFAKARLGIYQFDTPEKGPRIPKLFTDENVVLFGFDELQDMVRDTYAVWKEVCETRAEESAKGRARKTGSGGLFS